MSRKSFIILIGILIIVILLAVGFGLYFNAKKNNGGQAPTLRDFFPFGQGGKIIDLTPNGPGDQPNTNQSQNAQQQNNKILRLRKISENPVVGYVLASKEVPVDPNNIPEPKVITITPTFIFTKELKLGSKSKDVTELQKILNQCPQTIVAEKGVGSPGRENTVFGKTTQIALTKLQELLKDDILVPQKKDTGTGILDKLTRDRLTTPFNCLEKINAPKTITRPIVRYVEKGSSNIFDAFSDTLENKRLTNTTIPRVEEAFFGNEGKTVFMRYLRTDNSTIETYVGNVPEPIVGGDALPELSGNLLPSDMLDMSLSPDGKQLFYLTPSGNELLGFVTDLSGQNQKKIFNSPFAGWLSQWATPTKIIFTIKATGYGKGYAYGTDIIKGGFDKVIGGITGLTTLMSPDGSYVLFSRNTANGPALGLMATKDKTVRDLNLNTLPEKCVWGKTSLTIYCAVPNDIPSGQVYPDNWYQGSISFDDSVWSIDATNTYQNQLLFTPEAEEGGEPTDGIRLGIDTTNTYLYFINKKNNILWQYALVEPTQPTNEVTQ